MAFQDQGPDAAPFMVFPADPSSPEAVTLTRQLSAELARRYDFVDDGGGRFKPDEALLPGSAFLIGRVDGHPVACGALRPLSPGVAEIKRMFVLPSWRGRGLSKILLTELEERARALGYTVVRLETGDRQLEATRLYRGAGYRQIEKYGPYVTSLRSLCYEKRLAEKPGTRVTG